MQKANTITLINLILSFTSVFFIYHTTLAQKFMMSSVGVINGTSNYSSALNFVSNVNCINVQSGIAVFNGNRGAGEFAINCNISQEFNKLGIKMYPNPTKTTSNVKFVNTPPLNEEFMVSVLTTGGDKLISRKEIGYHLFQGIMLDLKNLVSGSYILQIESAHFDEAIIFIKAN